MHRIVLPNNAPEWFEAARRRVSVREYADAPPADKMETLMRMAASLSSDGVRVEICDEAGALMGSSGKRLKGVKIAAAIIRSKKTSAVMAGYKGEAFVLECAAENLGSCWLGGTFDKQEAKKTFRLSADEALAALIVFGVPLKELEEAPERSRKTLERITRLDPAAISELPVWQRNALECAQAAPSAMNMQPVRYTVGDNSVEARPSGLKLLPIPTLGLDLGIAMLHIEAGAVYSGVKPRWEKTKDGYKISVD